MPKNLKQEVKIKANIHSFILRGDILENSKEIGLLREFIKTKKKSILNYLLKTGVVLKHAEQHNLITTNGRNVLARLLTGDTTYSGQVNYGLLGTAVSPVPANASTQLGTEVFRKTFASHTASQNISYVDFFFAATDCNGTYTEFGNVIDGTASVNTGQLFSYIATGGWTKTNLQSLFISCQYTLN